MEKAQEKDYFEEVVGYEGVKKELEKVVDILNNKTKYEKLGVKMPHGIMFDGRPGVGKTLIAKCFLNALNRNSFVLRKEVLEDDFVLEIKKIFEEAKQNQPAVILLDDMDKFSNDDEFHQNSESFVTLQSLIDSMKDEDIFVIATVNSLRDIPSSLTRSGRFDYHFTINNPKGKDAEKIVKHYLQQKSYVASIDYKEIAKILYGMSCAELESVINQAGIYAGFEGKSKIEFEDIIRACEQVVYKTTSTMKNYSFDKNEKIAVHEAGHAVVAEILNPESVTLLSVGLGDGDIGGFTAAFQDDDEYFSDIENMKKKVKILLGGRCATEIVYGKIDVGATGDLDKAKCIIARFVGEYGELGLDKLLPTFRCESNDTLRDREQAVSNELLKYYQETKKLLTGNKTFLDEVAKKLLKKRVLTNKDIKEIKKKLKKEN